MLVSAKYSNAENTRIVATDDQGRVWSVPVDCKVGDWLKYLADGGQIDAYEAPPPPDLNAIDTETINQLLLEDGSVVRALAQALFAVGNDVRVLKGQSPMTVAQFKAYLKSLIR
jgi:hypothetical protein